MRDNPTHRQPHLINNRRGNRRTDQPFFRSK